MVNANREASEYGEYEVLMEVPVLEATPPKRVEPGAYLTAEGPPRTLARTANAGEEVVEGKAMVRAEGPADLTLTSPE